MGQAICLLSGGIDSPVAAFLAIKRGLKIRFIHFQPKAASVSEHRDKIEGIVKALKKFQWTTELLIVDFTKVQDELIVNVPPEYRMLIYRRMMIRIAGQFDKYLVLGDSLGQVASQTIQNLNAVYSAADGLILSPLIGFSKLEITNLARQIGTYELSIQGYPDCCAYFVPKHPELRATPESLDLIESKVDIDRLVNLGVENSRVLRI
jgi:thiamine biosynthesis protein ThiI